MPADRQTMLHSSFNPARMRAATLEGTFVQRGALVRRLTDIFGQNAIKNSTHNVLLVGPRGIGKSHLISVVYHRLKEKRELSKAMCIAYLREDEWGITSYLDLLMRIHSALAEDPDSTAEQTALKTRQSHPIEQMEFTLWGLIQEQLSRRKLLVIVENLDGIFRNIGDYGQKKLRALLQNERSLSLLATAPVLFPEVTRQSSPLFGSFEIVHLGPLSYDEAIELLDRLATTHRDADTAKFIRTPTGRARVRAVQHLANGNHRIFVLFYEFLRQNTAKDLLPPLIKMIDALTPYYQARMERLSPQQQKLVYFLCQRRSPATVKAIAEGCVTTHQTAASQLKQLLTGKHVSVNRIGRESYYELAEPLLRICVEVKSHRDEPLRLLVELLRYWFSRDELQERLTSTATEDFESTYISAALREYDTSRGHTHLTPEIAQLCNSLDKAGDKESERICAQELAELSRIAEDWSHFVLALNRMGKSAEAVPVLESKVKERPNDWRALVSLGRAYYGCNQEERSLECFDQALRLNPTAANIWYDKGDSLRFLNRTREALVCYDKAIKCEPNMPIFVVAKARALHQLGKRREAERLLKSLLPFADIVPDAYYLYGGLLAERGDFSAALRYLDKATTAFPCTSYAWKNKARVLLELRRPMEAIEAIRHFMKLEPEDDTGPDLYCGALLATGEYETAYREFSSEVISHRLFHIVVDLYHEDSGRAEIKRQLLRVADAIQRREWQEIVSGSLVQFAKRLNELRSSTDSDKIRKWNFVLTEAFGGRREYALVVKVFDVIARFAISLDKKILLELPLEQRELIFKNADPKAST